MPGFNTIPGSAGGGGAGALNYVGAVYMSTYNRSWDQAGVAGNYAVYSQNQEQGYAYFVGTGITTGTSLNKMITISHAFTRIDIVGVVGDVVSLYKTKVKSTTAYSAALPAFPFTTAATKSIQTLTTSGTYTHSTAAGTLGLVNVIIAGGAGAAGGGHGAGHGGGGGGGGGNVVILNAIPVAATTIIEIGSAGVASGNSTQPGTSGGKTYFGNLYAIGGGGGGGWSSDKGLSGGNGGGGCAGHSTGSGGSGTVQTSSQGLDLSGTIGFFGGRPGGSGNPTTSTASRGGGGGGANGDGTAGASGSGGDGGQGHATTFTGSSILVGAGGFGISFGSGHGIDRRSGFATTHACGGQGSNGSSGGQVATDNAQPGIILVGVYTL